MIPQNMNSGPKLEVSVLVPDGTQDFILEDDGQVKKNKKITD